MMIAPNDSAQAIADRDRVGSLPALHRLRARVLAGELDQPRRLADDRFERPGEVATRNERRGLDVPPLVSQRNLEV